MNNKKVISFIAVLLAVLMAVSLIVSVLPVTAFAVSQADLDEAQRKKDELVAQRTASQEKINQLKEQQASVFEQKAALDERNEYVQEQVDLVKEQIQMYSDMIAEKMEEVEAAKEKEAEQLERYRTRVRAMEENGGYNILAIIFNSSTFSELLTSLDDIGEIMESDRQLEDQYIAAREEHQRVQAEYEQIKAELEEKQAELENEKAELEALLEEADRLLAELEEDIEKAIKEYEIAERAERAAASELQNIANQLNNQNNQIKKPNPGEGSDNAGNGGESSGGDTSGSDNSGGNNSGNGSSGGGLPSAGGSDVTATGSLMWPVPSGHTVTSRFGWRIHPITGKEKYHSGMDIDGYGRDGYPIVACDNGVVAVARYSDSYGNYIMIDHGNGMQTVYAHMSGFAVSAGDTVTQGQTIGYLGSTGWSTGTHCHLEILVNGSQVNPESYFSGITFYDC